MRAILYAGVAALVLCTTAVQSAEQLAYQVESRSQEVTGLVCWSQDAAERLRGVYASSGSVGYNEYQSEVSALIDSNECFSAEDGMFTTMFPVLRGVAVGGDDGSWQVIGYGSRAGGLPQLYKFEQVAEPIKELDNPIQSILLRNS